MTNSAKFQGLDSQKEGYQLSQQQKAISNYLISSLLGSGKPPIPPTFLAAIPNPDEFPHWIAIIIPNSQFYVKQTVRRMTELFTASTYGQITGTYTNEHQEVEEEINWLVISWCDEESLNEHWQTILDHATDLQQSLNQECIAVIRDGSLVLVRQWG